MQLPPTILSLDRDKNVNKKKDKLEKQAGSQRLKPEVVKDVTVGLNQGTTTTTRLGGSGDEDSDSEMLSNDELDGGLSDGVVPQMSSIISSKRVGALIPPRTLETTLFDRLEKMYGTSIKKMLEIQYR